MFTSLIFVTAEEVPPAKKPEPVMVSVVGAALVPVAVLIVVTVGATPEVTANFAPVEFVPPPAVTAT